jgi:hypothetical protein
MKGGKGSALLTKRDKTCRKIKSWTRNAAGTFQEADPTNNTKSRWSTFFREIEREREKDPFKCSIVTINLPDQGKINCTFSLLVVTNYL